MLDIINLKNDKEITPFTKKLIDTGIGYRIDTEDTSGITNIKRIVKYEVEELGNEDILDTLRLILDKPDFSIKDLKNYVNDFSKHYPYGLWLSTDIKTTKELYSSMPDLIYNTEDTVSKYRITGKAYLLSDIGSEGTLLALPKNADKYYEGELE